MRLVGNVNDILIQLALFDKSKEYVCDITEAKSKRSIEQNKMLWELIHKIADKTHNEDIDVYCSLLERTDAKSEYIITAEDLENELKKSFRGVKFIRMQEVNGKDCYVYKVYIGSSKMNIAEMTSLIDMAMNICAEYGIEVYD